LTSDADTFRAAKLIIDQRGAEAATFAARRADLLFEDGDLEGSAVWRRLAAMEELQRQGARARR
jgi:hypothetical protein